MWFFVINNTFVDVFVNLSFHMILRVIQIICYAVKKIVTVLLDTV